MTSRVFPRLARLNGAWRMPTQCPLCWWRVPGHSRKHVSRNAGPEDCAPRRHSSCDQSRPGAVATKRHSLLPWHPRIQRMKEKKACLCGPVRTRCVLTTTTWLPPGKQFQPCGAFNCARQALHVSGTFGGCICTRTGAAFLPKETACTGVAGESCGLSRSATCCR